MTTVAQAIKATRGAFKDVASVATWAARSPAAAAALHGQNLVYFNGAFSPPTIAHTHIASTLCQDPDTTALWVDPEPARPGKERWQDETMEERVEMCEIMVAEAGLGKAGVGTLRRDLGPELGTSPELFRVLRAMLGGPGQGQLIWALGADVFEGMQYWREKAMDCLQPGDTCDGICIFTREGWTEERLLAAAYAVGHSPCNVSVLPMPVDMLGTSSNKARQALVQEYSSTGVPDFGALAMLQPGVAQFCLSRPELCKIYAQQVARL